jgi:hypothetical protein
MHIALNPHPILRHALVLEPDYETASSPRLPKEKQLATADRVSMENIGISYGNTFNVGEDGHPKMFRSE